jgi:predicted lipoprotein with Yx(FWY)xxD motif
VATAASAPLAALAIAACGGGQRHTAATEDHERPVRDHRARARRLGKVLVDSRGGTVYLFRKDSRGKSFCAAACAAAKPGDTNGQRVTAFGAGWFAVSGAGQVVSRPASKPGGASIY